jgi:hypothetical protein
MANFPFIFGLGFFLRIFVPGLVGGFILALFRGQWHWFQDIQGITTFLLLSGLIGMILRVVYTFVGELLIGMYWPGWLRVWRVKALERRLREAEEILKNPPEEFFSNAGWRFLNAGRFVQLFPMDVTGKRNAAAPTMLGNVTATWLARLTMQYGLRYMASRSLEQHMTFVLTRLWFQLPSEMRKEISESFAETEALLGSMTVVAMGALAFAVRGIRFVVAWLKAPHGDFISQVLFGPVGKDFANALLLVLLAFIIYIVTVKRMAGGSALYDAIFGQFSAAQLEEVIEESKKALNPPAAPTPKAEAIVPLELPKSRGGGGTDSSS